MRHYNLDNKTFVVDKDLCKMWGFKGDHWDRTSVTPFTAACYIYHALNTLHKSPKEVYDAVTTKWDSLIWRGSPINISLWNRLFNGQRLSKGDWKKVGFPLKYIDTLYTCVTSSNVKHECHVAFTSDCQTLPSLLIYTDESYNKFKNGSTSKITMYSYGQAEGKVDLIQGIIEDTFRVIIPF